MIQTVMLSRKVIYYFGGEDDGAMTTGWLLMDITYDEATMLIMRLLQHSTRTKIRAVGSTSSPMVRRFILPAQMKLRIKLSMVKSIPLTSMVQW